ncbi:segregation and condensation protein A [Rhodococcoides yunnanense]|jgi:segregation and condensation protein A|uniref:segregation and condensation protein A n=1 Tax=Rhodococcoides yunnanense TaxID=278209 RepID=UPI0022B19E11|nr:segregation/condensation protein A [Rhodococcus yunnanensis]MCZ4275304.1 segregation/condensation protein A [Rhodococcus yunnanensis]
MTQPVAENVAVEVPENEDPSRFRVRLLNFEGPFDLLLTLISQHRLDVTEVALHTVTDDFIAFTKSLGREMGLDQTTEFLVVAATLLDLKAARLLPSGDVEDAEDLALLEVRDLLFARLLQYRAYKQVAQLFGELEAAALRRYPRSVSVEDRYTDLIPEVLLGVDPARFADIAAAAFRPKPIPTVGLDHIHQHSVSVPEQARWVLERLEAKGENMWTPFGELTEGCESTVEIVARFLALLELFREQVLAFDQPEPLGELMVSWTGKAKSDEVVVAAVDYG